MGGITIGMKDADHAANLLATELEKRLTVESPDPLGCKFRLGFDAQTDRVLAMEFIPKCGYIGEVFGTPRYIWELDHSNFMFVDQERVIDVSCHRPKQILSCIRDDNQTSAFPNCEIVVDHSGDSLRFFVISTAAIHEGHELVLVIPER